MEEQSSALTTVDIGGSWWDALISIPKMLGRQIVLDDLLAEGGFSFVYTGTDCFSNQQFAIKKILVQSPEQRNAVLKEICYHRYLSSKYLLPLIDVATVKDSPVGEDFYLLLPLYQQSLRNHIDNIRRQSKTWDEKELLKVFESICEGVSVLHEQTPALAHRDIKPENILLDTDMTPVLMDFGSMAEAEVLVTSRLEALKLQDTAAEHSSMAYRAPELFDIGSQSQVNAKTDVWALGCTLYAMAFGYSPFECEFRSSGELQIVECSQLRVIGKWNFPEDCQYSFKFCDIIRWILQVDATTRPTLMEIRLKLQQIM